MRTFFTSNLPLSNLTIAAWIFRKPKKSFFAVQNFLEAEKWFFLRSKFFESPKNDLFAIQNFLKGKK